MRRIVTVMKSIEITQHNNIYIGGRWVSPAAPNWLKVIDPSDESIITSVMMGSPVDVDLAVKAAKAAFGSWSQTTIGERVEPMKRLISLYRRRIDEMARAISSEMGAPHRLARSAQAEAGLRNLESGLAVALEYPFEQLWQLDGETDKILREPVGICGLITPWNWPMNQVTLKLAPALLAGCTVILKPSEVTPLSALLLTEMIDEADFPPGVFNLINGEGSDVGSAIAGHPEIDMVSFTGSSNAGKAVACKAAGTVKRVMLELGGNSPNLVFADADLPNAIVRGVKHCFQNSGQSCNSPSRMLVERAVYDQVVEIAADSAKEQCVDRPQIDGDHIGPVAYRGHYEKVQGLITAGIDEGARLVAGGPGRPVGFDKGYYVQPTVFGDVNNSMTIAREEIFGPVLTLTPFDDRAEAVELANDTDYGLSAYIQSGDRELVEWVAKRLRVGQVQVNGARSRSATPFGGYKQSGNGREGGRWGLEEFLETKAVSG